MREPSRSIGCAGTGPAQVVEPSASAVDAAAIGPATERLIDDLIRRQSSRVWAAVMLALDLATCRSFLIGRRVLARRLDGEVLRRALRGGPLPPSDDYIAVTGAMLDAVAEAGSLVPKRGQR